MNILENQQLAEPVDGIYIDLEAQILQNIARHLQGWEQPIDTDRWLMQKLAEIGKLNQRSDRPPEGAQEGSPFPPRPAEDGRP